MIPIDSSKKSGRRGGGHTGDEDEGALWDQVVRDVTPLPHKKKGAAKTDILLPSVKTKSVTNAPVISAPVIPVKVKARTPGDQEVDRRTEQKLKRGQYPVDMTLDLHGLTQVAAHNKLVQTLQSGYARGLRCVLVITGKGRAGPGVLRRQVPEWLSDENLRGVVLRFHKAQPGDGGDGALYVLLKRKRSSESL